MKNFLLLFVAILLIFISCSTGYIVNMNEKTKFPEGRELFVSKCNGCHKYHNPTEFTTSKWDSILIVMRGKAKLSESEKNLIQGWIFEKINNDTLKNEQSNELKRDNN